MGGLCGLSIIFFANTFLVLLALNGVFGSWRIGTAFSVLWAIASYTAVWWFAWRVWRLGFGPARWFVLAWSVWVFASIAAALAATGVFGMRADLLEFFCWGIGLAERVTLMNAEQEQAEAFAQAQAQLVDAEKHAAVGRLGAGILHEMNSPLGALQSSADTVVRSLDKARALTADLPDQDSSSLKKLTKVLRAGGALGGNIDQSSQRISEVLEGLKRFVSMHESVAMVVASHQRSGNLTFELPDAPLPVDGFPALLKPGAAP